MASSKARALAAREASLLKHGVKFLANRASACISELSCASSARIANEPSHLQVSESTGTVLVGYSGGVEALEFGANWADEPLAVPRVSSLGVVPHALPAPRGGAFWPFATAAIAWIAADVTWDAQAQAKLLAQQARCFGTVGADKVIALGAEIEDTTCFLLPYPIVLDFDRRIVSFDFDVVDLPSGVVSGRGTDVIHFSQEGKVEQLDTVRHVRCQPSWVVKQLTLDPLSNLASTRIPNSILPSCTELPRHELVPRPSLQAAMFTPHTDPRVHHPLHHPAVCGSSVPVIRFGAGEDITVVVMAEWWGVDSGILDLARSLASALGPGATAVIPNFYRDGVIPVDANWDMEDIQTRCITEPAYKMAHTNWEAVASDVAAIVSSASGKVALVGFSFGAVAALLAAQQCSVACVVAWYGSPDIKFTGGAGHSFNPANVQVPVQLQWASYDKIAGFSDVATGQQLSQSLPRAEYVEHPHEHGFLNDRSWWASWKASLEPPRMAYSADIAQRSWDDMLSFLQKHLQPPLE